MTLWGEDRRLDVSGHGTHGGFRALGAKRRVGGGGAWSAGAFVECGEE